MVERRLGRPGVGTTVADLAGEQDWAPLYRPVESPINFKGRHTQRLDMDESFIANIGPHSPAAAAVSVFLAGSVPTAGSYIPPRRHEPVL